MGGKALGGRSEARLKLTLPSRLEAIEVAELVTAAVLEHLGLGDVEKDRAVLAVREAVANAMTHGNRLDPDSGVEIELLVDSPETSGDPRTVIVRVSDGGNGFDPAGLPDPLAPENLIRPTGRGILLMKSFMDEVGFSFPSHGGTVVTLSKRVAARSPTNE